MMCYLVRLDDGVPWKNHGREGPVIMTATAVENDSPAAGGDLKAAVVAAGQ